MPATVDDLKKVIQEEFEDSDFTDIDEENHRINGTIRWPGFKGKTIEERNRLVTEKIRRRLGYEGLSVGVLFPLTPGEQL